jgi:transcriptional regulator with GAF, ATPase, and Fis domain
MSGLSNHNLIGVSRCFREVIDHLILCAKTDVTILIEVETGTGNELAARAAHECRDRQSKPFILLNL